MQRAQLALPQISTTDRWRVRYIFLRMFFRRRPEAFEELRRMANSLDSAASNAEQQKIDAWRALKEPTPAEDECPPFSVVWRSAPAALIEKSIDEWLALSNLLPDSDHGVRFSLRHRGQSSTLQLSGKVEKSDAAATIRAWSILERPPQTDADLESAVPEGQSPEFYAALKRHYEKLRKKAEGNSEKAKSETDRERWERIAGEWGIAAAAATPSGDPTLWPLSWVREAVFLLAKYPQLTIGQLLNTQRKRSHRPARRMSAPPIVVSTEVHAGESDEQFIARVRDRRRALIKPPRECPVRAKYLRRNCSMVGDYILGAQHARLASDYGLSQHTTRKVISEMTTILRLPMPDRRGRPRKKR